MMDERFPSGSRRPPGGVTPPRVDLHDAEKYYGKEVHLLDYVRVLSRRRWVVLTVFLVVFLAATVYAFTKTPVYEARVRLLIEVDNPNVIQFQQVLEERQSSYLSDYYETQYQLLQSRSLVRETLDELDLWEERDFLGVPGMVESVASLVAQGARLVPLTPDPLDSSASEQDEETLAQSRAIDLFLDSFSVGPVRNSRLVDLSYRSTHPRLAVAVINGHADTYVKKNLEFRFVTSRDATEWLGEQLVDQRRAVEESEVALHRYRQEHDAVSLEDRENIVVQRLTDLNAALTLARTELIKKESVYRQMEAIASNSDAVDALPAVVSNRFIQEVRAEVAGLRRQRAELSENLGSLHPDMVKVQSATVLAEARLQGEIDKVVESIRNEFFTAQVQAQSLARELDAQKNDALAMNEMSIGYGVLARDVESNRQIYDSLLKRAKETGVSAQLRSSNIRVIDRAEVPNLPVSPRKSLILLIALFAGGFGGVGLAFFYEYLDDRIKTPEDLKAHLGLAPLGMVPTILPKSLKAGVSPLINNGVPPEFSEAFRTIRTGVIFSTTDNKRSLVVTSSGPGEGKSVVTANLGIGLAQAMERVLVIDADMRRPTLHTVFGCGQEPGLSNLLVGDAKSQEVLHKTSEPGLWLLPAGRIPPNPAELLGSEKFKALLDSLRDLFTWILIDTPPVMAVTDASVVAHAASGIIFVVGSDMTSRQVGRQALDQLEVADTFFVGAILNRVDLEGNAYYYSQYYRSEYQQCYIQDGQSAASTHARGSTIQL